MRILTGACLSMMAHVDVLVYVSTAHVIRQRTSTYACSRKSIVKFMETFALGLTGANWIEGLWVETLLNRYGTALFEQLINIVEMWM